MVAFEARPCRDADEQGWWADISAIRERFEDVHEADRAFGEYFKSCPFAGLSV
jgi:hypothetical protein